MSDAQPYVTIRARQPVSGIGSRHAEPAGDLNGGNLPLRSATHDISRTSFHMKHVGQFAKSLEESATRAFPNRGRSSQRYKKVQALLLHWGSDDLFVLPELEDLEKCLREDYAFDTDIFAIPSENSHLELMMRVGQLIKEHESPDTLFLIYYGGHARIDDSRQSTWCATRETNSSWLQWSAIQTLLERSKSDVLILLDCCAGAASATFPTGNSITETISASSWDAIAPDPGRYSFTNALIEVLQEWRMRAFSAAMLHAEVLARLKHPRPITINGKHFEARSTPVHFMMTANHKAPSIELCSARKKLPPSPPLPASPSQTDHGSGFDVLPSARGPDSGPSEVVATEPNEDTPHVMISLALEDDQSLDINAWEQWLGAFPALAKYIKVQGVFKSHSTLLLVSMPVMVWDMLPEDGATSFVAFIRSNNLVAEKRSIPPPAVPVPAHQAQAEFVGPDSASFISAVSGSTLATVDHTFSRHFRGRLPQQHSQPGAFSAPGSPNLTIGGAAGQPLQSVDSTFSLSSGQRQSNNPGLSSPLLLNHQQSMRRTTFGEDVPDAKKFSSHVERRLEEYYQVEPTPNDAQRAVLASNLGIEPWHLGVWFHHRRERDLVSRRFASMKLKDVADTGDEGPHMILAAALAELLELSLPGQVLLFDLRPQQQFQRSHIAGAINLRVPASFLSVAPFDLVERSFAREEDRATFSQRRQSRCFVFYSKGLDSVAECPAARMMLDKMRADGWLGECFILKGNYREYSTSYDKFIVGATMTTAARQWIQEKQGTKRTPSVETESQQRYTDWLSRIKAENRRFVVPSSSEQQADLAESLATQEQDLEVEFRARCNDLYRKARDIQADQDERSAEARAQMVAHLDRGLGKLRGELPPERGAATAAAAAAYSTTAAAGGQGPSKLQADEYVGGVHRGGQQDDAEEYVDVGRADEARRGLTRYSTEAGSPAYYEDGPRRGGRGGGLLNKMFRRG